MYIDKNFYYRESVKMAIIIGMEPANSNVKVVSNILKKVDMYLNTTTKLSTYGNGEGVHVMNTYKVKVNGDEEFYLVGELQKDKRKTKSSSGDEDRYQKPEFKVESEIALFRELAKIQKETGRDAFNEEIVVVTGVPTSHAVSKKCVNDIKQALVGDHEVNGKKFTVRKIYVLKQGLSAFYHMSLDEEGNPNTNFFKSIMSEDYLLIDIGHGTTDFQWIKNGAPHESTEMSGFKEVYNNIMESIVGGNYENFNTAYKPKLTALSIAPEMEKGDYINITGEKIPVKELKEKFYLKYANDILTMLNEGEFNDYEFTKIAFVGGGSYGLKNYLEKAIEEKYKGKQGLIDRFLLEDIKADGQKFNALGYMKYGIYALKQQGVEV